LIGGTRQRLRESHDRVSEVGARWIRFEEIGNASILCASDIRARGTDDENVRARSGDSEAEAVAASRTWVRHGPEECAGLAVEDVDGSCLLARSGGQRCTDQDVSAYDRHRESKLVSQG
jgi:hypothetical protein